VQGVERTWLIQKMARTPCRHALECRTKNCLFKHPSKPEDYARLGSVNGGGDPDPQRAPPFAGDRLGRVHGDYQSMSVYVDASATHSPPASPPVAMPVTLPYQWPPSQPLVLGYPVISYYPHPPYFMGMAPPTMYYEFGTYANVPAYPPSPILAPNLYAYESSGEGDAYPGSVSFYDNVHGEGSAFVEGGGPGRSPQFLPASPTSSTDVPPPTSSIDEKHEADLLLPKSPSEDAAGVPEKAELPSDDASSSMTCVVIEATTSVLVGDKGDAGRYDAQASGEHSYDGSHNDDRCPTDS
jgi:hypothetical protein